ncbi:glycoside hydrolase family 18 protein [Collybiopsis luxurians FD-317 M1]|uniref:Glycoside hydrolase family 18 protein n=1 Tax=Collybiopsis luxurians FD-317 M1 TaxID=944289 RepID=A0A0D0CM74_9AGAR|nr:glycoside hydrolase family 18 protein [Collybiopsis luxurians FD-317 M1]
MVPAAPRFVAYADRWVSGVNGPPPVEQVKGFNVFALSFLLTKGAFDKALEWQQLSAAQRATVKSQYKAAGVSLIVSAFGSTETPTSSGADPIATANTMASWVTQYGLDGIDVDYEDFDAFNNGSAVAWLVSFTKQLRTKLPQGTYILTHARNIYRFCPNRWANGGYLEINKQVGNLIDWYNIQFYNQGANEYTTCAGLLTASSSNFAQSAVFQIAASGVPENKLVIGKPAIPSGASTGYMDPGTLATCVGQAKSKGWSAGVMTWQWPDGNAAWIKEVRSKSWPV